MAKKKQQPPAPDLTFEQSLAELQQIVDDLEGGQLGLDKSMQRFEQGIALLRRCYGTLETAEQKIEILTGTDAEGNPVTEPFDGTATVRQQKSAGKRKRTAEADSVDLETENPAQPDGLF